ncbi:flagellar assembly protein FliX [Phenylobacterium parvum]|uniref:Flagellar assembly protein FliX n=1 Tax=Phenylobacterium parvum TaxID=2201350 RepID=A0A2Z3HS71_9CAUL|nr:flagellar assembly protein FliX [Phenylobacterium parvum]AWM77655.1 flagellar assembly protein FliX [Phenylobacterium parvum]
MKVTGPNGVSSGPASGRRTGAAGGGFSVPAAGASGPAAPSSPAAGTSGLMGVEALLALQDVGGPLEGRRRSVRRATRLLDVLDDLRIALIDGIMRPDQVRALASAIAEQRSSTGDPRLEAVLDEIETRAAVEMAKMEMRGFAS